MGGPGTAAHEACEASATAGPDHDTLQTAEHVVAKGSARRWKPATPGPAITLQLRLGAMLRFGAGGRNRTRNPLLTRQSLIRIELRRRWYPAQESNPETAGFAGPPEIRLAR